MPIEPRIAAWCRLVALAVAVLAPLPWASEVAPVRTLWALVAAATLGLAWWRLPRPADPLTRRVALCAAGLLALAAVQLVPLPRTVSIAPTRTFGAAILLATAVAIGTAIARAGFPGPASRTLRRAIAASLLLQVGLALVGTAGPAADEWARGTFYNRNHFAAFLAAAAPAAASLTLARGGADRVLGAVALIAAGIGLVAAGSRAALVAASAAALVFGLCTTARRRRLGGAALAIALLFAASLGAGRLTSGAASEALALRATAWQASLEAIAERPLLGHGMGCFVGAFMPHRPAALEQRWRHAHNEPLEWWVEGGVVQFGLIAAAIAAIATALPRRWRGLDARRREDAAVALAALVAYAVQSLVDFPLRIPANALFAAVMLGWLLSASRER